jgi:hypothetical protein
MARRARLIRFPKAPPRPPDADLVEVRRCGDEAEALVVKSLLESEEIPCVLRSRLAHSVHPFTVGAQGEVVVLVPAAEAPRARLVLARISPGPSFP